jgi:putative membrane protein
MNIIIRVLINAAALWVAAYLIADITLSDRPLVVLLVAGIFGLVNAFIRPIVKVIAFPITLLTLGLFTLVINAAMLQLTDWLTTGLDVRGFWTSVLGGIVISIVSWVLSVFVYDERH